MSKQRLEAFSDGVIAILITIMVLELSAPPGTSLTALVPLAPIFLSYLLSFVFIAIYWNNHHHMLQAVKFVNGRILWANMHLLFWLSLIPFVTAWMGANPLAPWPISLYGLVLFLCAVAYYLLSRSLIAANGRDSELAAAIGRDFKGVISMVFYLVAIPTSFFLPWVSYAFYVLVAVIWLIPDRRIEKRLVH